MARIPSISESLEAKVGVAFLVVMVVMSGIGAFAFVETGTEVRDDTTRRLEASAEVQAATLAQWVDEMEHQAHFLATSAAVQSGDTDRITRFLNRQLAEGRLPSEIVTVNYVDTTVPKVRATTNRKFAGLNPAKAGVPWAQGGIDVSEPTVTDPFVTPTGAQAIAVIAPVPETKHAIVMVVSLQKRIESLPRPVEDSFVSVVDDEGTVVLSHRSGRMLGDPGASGVTSPAVTSGLNGSAGYTETAVNGTATATGYAPVAGTDWVVTVNSPKTAAFAVRTQVRRQVLFLLGAALLGFLLVGGVIARGTTRELRRLADRAAELESGNFDVALESDRADEVGQLCDALAATRDSLCARIEEAESASEAAAAREAEMEARADHLQEVVDDYRATMQRAAEGDLTARMEPDTETDSLRALAETFNETMDELAGTIERTQAFAGQVAAASRETADRTARLADADELAAITADADEQRESFREISAELESLSDSVEEVAVAADGVATTAEEVVADGERGRAAAEAAIAEMDEIGEVVAATREAVAALDEEVVAIGETVDRVADVAEQTNMLALNASIEAARAGSGDAGDGFAVVAEEIMALAEEAEESAAEIERRLDAVRESTDRTVGEMETVADRVDEGTTTVSEAADALREIVDGVEDATAGIRQIDEATDEQAQTADRVVERVERVADGAAETARKAEEVSEAATERTESLVAVTDRARSLSEGADELAALLDSFATDGDAADTLDLDAVDAADASNAADALDAVGDGVGATDPTDGGPDGAPDASGAAPDGGWDE